MIKSCKICGVSDSKTLNFIIKHPFAPEFIGFICNYKKSPRYVEFEKLKNLLKVDKNGIKFVAVLVKPDMDILEKIKDLEFDYYQLYDCKPDEIKLIKDKYRKKIITAFTVETAEDLKKFNSFKEVTDIYLFDSKGYEKSISFNHNLIKNLNIKKNVMVAGNIQFNDNLDNFNKIADIIDISGGLETSGQKDISKIEIFLKNVESLKNEN